MKYVCDICGYVYDPELGDPENGVAPVICNCKHVTLADIDDALQRSAHFSDVEKEFAEVQRLTSCSTGCGGCHDKIMAVLSERLSG